LSIPGRCGPAAFIPIGARVNVAHAASPFIRRLRLLRPAVKIQQEAPRAEAGQEISVHSGCLVNGHPCRRAFCVRFTARHEVSVWETEVVALCIEPRVL